MKILAKIFPSVVWHKDPKVPRVYLTFDDGPHPEFTPGILEVLQQFNAKATFFVVGHKVRQYPHILKQVHAAGHTIGAHSWSHCNLMLKTRQFLLKEMLTTQQAISNVFPPPPKLFRPPYGRFSPGLIKICRQLDLTIVMWSLSSSDYDLKISNSRILSKIRRQLTPGSIILLHDGACNSHRTLAILPEVIQIIQDHGFSLASL